MKTKRLLLAALLAGATAASAAPLTATAAVHTRPDEASPSVTFLKAGSEPTVIAAALASTPAGWLAVELPGPFEGYVQNKDIQKNLDVRLDAPVYLAPKIEAGVLTTAEKTDKIEITGLRGKWTQLRLEKKITGYIRLGGTPAHLAPAAVASAPAPKPPVPAPLSPAPVTPAAYGAAAAGQAAPMLNLGDGGSSTLPRQFAGKFASTRRPFAPRRPYDWALNDDAGVRYAYLDLSKLLLTEQIESYAGHAVVVFGAAKSANNGRDLVIEVEGLQLK